MNKCSHQILYLQKSSNQSLIIFAGQKCRHWQPITRWKNSNLNLLINYKLKRDNNPLNTQKIHSVTNLNKLNENNLDHTKQYSEYRICKQYTSLISGKKLLLKHLKQTLANMFRNPLIIAVSQPRFWKNEQRSSREVMEKANDNLRW